MSTYPHPVIEQVRVRNYRSLADIQLSLHPLTVLVGPNSSGKSNLIDVLRFMRDAVARDLDSAILDRGGMSLLRRWSPTRRPYDVHLGVSVAGERWSGEYSFTLGSESKRGYRVKRERFRFEDEGSLTDWEVKEGRWVREPQLPEELRKWLPSELPTSTLSLHPLTFLNPPSSAMTDFLQDMSFYTIYPDVLRDPQKPLYTRPLEERGLNLASVLRGLKESSDKSAEESIRLALERVVPDVAGFSVEQAGSYLVTKLKHGSSAKSSSFFELARESDGTLRMLGILTALYQQPPRSLLAIEEPELTVHPGALGVLCDVLEEASLRSQVLITTHSPDLIADFPTNALTVVEKEEGITRAGPVSEQQRKAIADKLFDSGELLRVEGLRRDNKAVGAML